MKSSIHSSRLWAGRHVHMHIAALGRPFIAVERERQGGASSSRVTEESLFLARRDLFSSFLSSLFLLPLGFSCLKERRRVLNVLKMNTFSMPLKPLVWSSPTLAVEDPAVRALVGGGGGDPLLFCLSSLAMMPLSSVE